MAHLLHVLALAVIFSKPTAPSQCYTTTIHAGGLPVELHPASSKSIEEQHLRNKLVTSQATFRDFSLGLESSTVCDAMPTQPGVLEGDWYLTEDKHVLFEPRACMLRRLTGNGVRRCLRGRSVAIVGDSVSRYIFLDLAYFLTHSQHHPRYHHSDMPHLARENEWGGWAKFYNGTSELLGQAVDAVAKVDCDCYRPEMSDPERANIALYKENRDIRLCVDFDGVGEAEYCAEGGPGWRVDNVIRLQAVQALGHPTWQQAMTDAVWKFVHQPHPPSVIVLNVGFWIRHKSAPMDTITEQLDAMFINVSGMVEQGGHRTKLLWREMTHSIKQTEWFAGVREVSNTLARKHGLPVLDAYSILLAADRQHMPRTAVWWDSDLGARHPWQYVYENINDALLNVLCDRDCEWQMA